MPKRNNTETINHCHILTENPQIYNCYFSQKGRTKNKGGYRFFLLDIRPYAISSIGP